MKLLEEPTSLEILAKQILQYFLDLNAGDKARANLISILQNILDELNNYYFFTKPYQLLSGNSKLAEKLTGFLKQFQAMAVIEQWSVELTFEVIKKVSEFLNKNDWSLDGINNKFITALSAKAQEDLKVDQIYTVEKLKNLLYGKNGKIFCAELENALGKAISQHKQDKIAAEADAELVKKTALLNTYETLPYMFDEIGMPIYLPGDTREAIVPATSPILAPSVPSMVFSFGLAKIKDKVQSTFALLTADDGDLADLSEDETKDEYSEHSYHSLILG